MVGSIFKSYHRPALAADAAAAAAARCEYHFKANCRSKVHNANLNLNLRHRQFRGKLSKNSLITIIKLFTNQSEMSAVLAGNVIVKERNNVSYQM